jgi:hypothetical protein
VGRQLFLLLIIAYAYFLPRVADWNGNSRFDLTLAIVEEQRLAIDSFFENTGDYARYGGHIYTDKAPGLSFLAVAPYAACRWAAGSEALRSALRHSGIGPAAASALRKAGARRKQTALARRLQSSEQREPAGPPRDGPWEGPAGWRLYFATALYVCTLAVVALPCALAGLALYRLLLGFDVGARAALLATLGYGLGSAAFPYATAFYGQAVAAGLLLAAWERLHALRRGVAGQAWWLGVGALLGLAVLVELAAALPAFWLALYGLGAARARGLALLAAGALPAALALAAYNAACFGSPFATGYRFLGRFPEISSYGVTGFGAPRLDALYGLTLSPFRGLFVYSPFLLLALPGWRELRRAHAAESRLCLVAFVAQLLLISGWHDWKGGAALGPRNLLVALPFLLVPAAAFLQASWREPPRRAIGVALVALSCLVTVAATVSAGDFPPPSYANPLRDYYLPRLLAGELTPNLGMLAGLRGSASLIGLVIPLALGWRLCRRVCAPGP